MRSELFIFLMLICSVGVLAETTTVTIQMDHGNGVLLRLIYDDEVVLKPKTVNYPTGVAFSEFDTTLDDFDLRVHLKQTENGDYDGGREIGPFKSGEEILLDYRDGVLRKAVVEEPAKDSEAGASTANLNDTKNDTKNDTAFKEDAPSNDVPKLEASGDSSKEEKISESGSFTGNVIKNADGSIKWGYLSAFAVLLLILIFFFVKRKPDSKKIKVIDKKRSGSKEKSDEGNDYDDEDKELEELQRKVREKAEKIRIIKEKRMKKDKIIEARRKLAEEEHELSELTGGPDRTQKIEEAKRKLEAQERELNSLKGSGSAPNNSSNAPQ